ncbi:NADH-quinone oxidoreductase subunit A [Streptomyces reniochalinae]|uniref:NADH-quinone oxidoreductase subunit n=1 Tax=Streptomyces reniochalinae TaxID=2250578 RepID=A0A367EUB2_9ACTN|nr:NADH-quinone oxidoreductase subunit A [Streptomyces reniochalinae]
MPPRGTRAPDGHRGRERKVLNGPVGGLAAALSLLAVVLLAVGGLHGVSRLLRVSAQPLSAVPFGSGLEPAEHAVSRFHVRWYTVTMLFLAFDMEMVFMYPWTRVVSAVGPGAVIEMFVFLGILFAGVTYAWREGALRWT